MVGMMLNETINGSQGRCHQEVTFKLEFEGKDSFIKRKGNGQSVDRVKVWCPL